MDLTEHTDRNTQRGRSVDGIRAPVKTVKQVEPVQVEKHIPKKIKRKPYFIYVSTALILLAALGFGLWFVARNTSPIPQNIRTAAGFPIYYPSELPAGYKFQRGSAEIDNNIIIYKIQNKSDTITISEQNEPAVPPDISALTKPQQVPGPSGITSPTMPALFHSAYSPAGQAVIGTGPSDNSVAVILTDKTIINISASLTLPENLLPNIVQNMKPLTH